MSSDLPDPDDMNVEPRTMRFQGVPSQDSDHVETIDPRGLTAEDQATIEALRPGRAVRGGPGAPTPGAGCRPAHLEGGPGPHPDSDIFLDDVTVSRKHATFVARGGTYVVRDSGSLNGTYVNRERIDETTLHQGDEVQIGKFRLVYYSAGAAQRA